MCGDSLCRLLVVGVRGQIAIRNHCHTIVSLLDEPIFKRTTGRILGTDQPGDAFVREVIFKYIPSQFMGELKALNQALLLQLGQRACLRQCRRLIQCLECLEVIVKSLLPAYVLHHSDPRQYLHDCVNLCEST